MTKESVVERRLPRPAVSGGLVRTVERVSFQVRAKRSCLRVVWGSVTLSGMADRTFAFLGEHSDLRLEDGALVFPMPVECYDHLMDGESLPRGACYNGLRRVMEVDAAPNGRYHDPRTTAIYHLLQQLRLAAGVNAYAGTTAPLEGHGNDRRHPDAQFFVSPDKLAALRTASRPAPVPDLVVEVDTTPLSPGRDRERLAAYARMHVAEVWVWRRTGGTEAQPEGQATFYVLASAGYDEDQESPTIPGMRTQDFEDLLHEPDDLARDAQAEQLASRLAPTFATRWISEA